MYFDSVHAQLGQGPSVFWLWFRPGGGALGVGPRYLLKVSADSLEEAKCLAMAKYPGQAVYQETRTAHDGKHLLNSKDIVLWEQSMEEYAAFQDDLRKRAYHLYEDRQNARNRLGQGEQDEEQRNLDDLSDWLTAEILWWEDHAAGNPPPLTACA